MGTELVDASGEGEVMHGLASAQVLHMTDVPAMAASMGEQLAQWNDPSHGAYQLSVVDRLFAPTGFWGRHREADSLGGVPVKGLPA